MARQVLKSLQTIAIRTQYSNNSCSCKIYESFHIIFMQVKTFSFGYNDASCYFRHVIFEQWGTVIDL